ncbi:entericidin A/B family lipoprotein [Larsenimonas rhizosphaerae]|uniref:Entericidin A/B family lipoprotein n=1 Tax=Larsenimonas rhizosphaerae TaxID=2944682 RepID=A0AA41ZLS2_9GAMM|nr:entericidin A/B family lipoprotein [Larsenimonas rhizosphaerae]MCM2129826.1 entericidin A/B family lipoprotein [Larsenimonas rhizosphaerae]MCX2524486.1 entericidin A/B family lipoprotein [Larsenimonas rhizosphaerae]
MKKLLMLLVVSSLSTVALSGCNTMNGAGQDIEDGGEAIQNASE